MEQYGASAIVVSDYDPNWSVLFEQERVKIQGALGSVALVIEHMGSTAVPGLAAKPIIDLLVGVPNLEEARLHCVEPIKALGYTYLPHYESWLPGELFFRKGPPGPWTHHVHVMEPSHPRWEHFVLFRDYLRAHPEVARAYASIKRQLAASFNDDIAGYRNGKGEFVDSVMVKARAWKTQVQLNR
jgi:GrpB-like predicted nucleotidyltransferase (UPF0157 family)